MSEQTIRRVVVTKPGVVEIEEAAEPVPGPGEALIGMRVVGICGSDVHAVHGRHPFITLPYHPGHEVVGTVEATGAGVELGVGQRVVIEPILACGACKYCRDGRYNLCATMTFFGCTAPTGGLAERFVVPADRAVPVPDGINDALAALIEPLSTPVHAVHLAGPDLTGKTVAILGAGTIGLLTLVAARAAGAERIAVSDTQPAKLALARRLGAASVHDPTDTGMVDAIRADLGTSADVVFDCVARQQTIDQALAIAFKGGTVVVVGVPGGPVTVALPEIQDLQVRIQGSATYTRADVTRAIDMLAAGLVDEEDFVTARFPFDRAGDAFAEASGGHQIKVIVTAQG